MTEQGVGVVRPLPGNGLIAHVGGLLLVCDAAGAVAGELLDAVQETAAGGGDGRALARRVAQVLARSMTAEPITCAVAGRAGGGIAVLVSGDAQVTITGPGTDVRLDGQDVLTWTDRLVPGPISGVELRLPDAGQPIRQARLDGGVIPGGGLTCDYTESGGHVAPVSQHSRSSAAPVASEPPRPTAPPPPEPVRPREPVEYGRHDTGPSLPEPDHGPAMAGPRPAEPPPPHPVTPQGPPPPDVPPVQRREFEQPPALVTDPEMAALGGGVPVPEEQPEFESYLLIDGQGEQQQAGTPGSILEPTEAGPTPEPLNRPMVYGVDCKNDHFNDPRVPYCAVCGIALVQRTLVPYKGERPPLGVLLLDDGMTLRLDSDYLLGRDPERAPEVTSGEARPAKVTSPDGSVSRRHLRVRLDAWDVNLIDLGSVNGTQVQPPGDPNFYDIPPNEPVPILPGTTVRVGVSRTMRYESHRKG
ncbi:FHA domain-containing protein [Sphaerisporangium corydalis]|uniref:FHA domain-containing protein n=1 Tax=Sphaerisporangium corydalis TaxID=1441875 RepID=A0ABV9ECJ2_9ACTN|nr:FHA domain-containing protein [Sphaerisporangium corydalis]